MSVSSTKYSSSQADTEGSASKRTKWFPEKTEITTRAVHFAGLACLVAAVYSEDFLRIPGLEGGPTGLFLYAIRGVIVVLRLYLIWPVAAIGLLATLGLRTGPLWRLRPLTPFLFCLGGYGILSLASDMDPIAADFRLEMLTVYVLPVLLPLFLIRMPGGVIAIRNWFFWAGAFQALSTILLRVMVGATGMRDLVHVQNESTGRFIMTSDPITSSILLLLTALCAISIFTDKRGGRFVKAVAIFIAPLDVFLALSCGARGPIVSFVAAVLIVLVLGYKDVRGLVRGVLILAVSAFVALITSSYIAEKGEERLLSFAADALTGNTSEQAALTRLDYASLVLASEPTAFGYGIASFGQRVGNPIDYPHNVFLEAYYETGVIGLLFFSCILGYYAVQNIRVFFKTANPEIIFCQSCLMFYLIEYQFSGSLMTSQMLTAFLMLGAWTCAASIRTQRVSVQPVRKRTWAILDEKVFPVLGDSSGNSLSEPCSPKR